MLCWLAIHQKAIKSEIQTLFAQMPFKNLMSTKSSSHNYEFISITKQVIVILKHK